MQRGAQEGVGEHWSLRSTNRDSFSIEEDVRTFTSASAKEKHKISAKLQARFDGPYKVTGRVNAVVYWADINGEETRVHAMNMKPQNALITQTSLQRQDKEAEKEEKGGRARAPKARGFTHIEDID